MCGGKSENLRKSLRRVSPLLVRCCYFIKRREGGGSLSSLIDKEGFFSLSPIKVERIRHDEYFGSFEEESRRGVCILYDTEQRFCLFVFLFLFDSERFPYLKFKISSESKFSI